ncbi:hypothetical protein Tsubulata_027062, partial [Turnera subulata]
MFVNQSFPKLKRSRYLRYFYGTKRTRKLWHETKSSAARWWIGKRIRSSVTYPPFSPLSSVFFSSIVPIDDVRRATPAGRHAHRAPVCVASLKNEPQRLRDDRVSQILLMKLVEKLLRLEAALLTLRKKDN